MTDRADEDAITKILFLYTHAIDRRRWDIMSGLFHDDATFKFGTVEGDWRSFVDQARTLIDPMLSSHHLLGNVLINVDDDVAHSEAYLTATHVIPADYPKGLAFPSRDKRYLVTIAGRYVDRFEKRNGEWRIQNRQGLYDWREDRDVDDGGLFDKAEASLGQVGDADPSIHVTAPWRHR